MALAEQGDMALGPGQDKHLRRFFHSWAGYWLKVKPWNREQGGVARPGRFPGKSAASSGSSCRVRLEGSSAGKSVGEEAPEKGASF